MEERDFANRPAFQMEKKVEESKSADNVASCVDLCKPECVWLCGKLNAISAG